MSISVIIPTYRNTEVLVRNLRHNTPYLSSCEVIVVNDDPTNDIASHLNDFPQIILIQNAVNKGFAGTMNTGISKAKGEHLLFLNDDVKLLNDSYNLALANLKQDPILFAVSFAQKDIGGKISGRKKLFWTNGFIQHDYGDSTQKGTTGWADGGSCMVDGAKLRDLKGFDELFAPFYWEDIDLSYRAQKKGHTILFDPKILVEHHHETTIGSQFSKNHIQSIAYRNQLLCIWKNVTSWRLIINHKWFLIKLLAQSIAKGDTVFLEGFFQALLRFPRILVAHFLSPSIISDYEILSRNAH